ncbi:hypothetical protein E2C01_059763 [Portunus trituberculatus]|uniref:Uncharacterized protein n=1 Tax=Portunus trituberculatus TaxID=210409 RepID=A0A5B7H7J6_PORTR|nr:hypothetical protein [Portunus trituberculatus]
MITATTNNITPDTIIFLRRLALGHTYAGQPAVNRAPPCLPFRDARGAPWSLAASISRPGWTAPKTAFTDTLSRRKFIVVRPSLLLFPLPRWMLSGADWDEGRGIGG